MTIAAVLSHKGREVATISRSASLGDAAGELARRRIGALVVVDEHGAVAGVISERDLVTCLAEHGDDALLKRPVEAAMTAPAVTVLPSTQVLTALAMMTARRIRHLPVLHEGRLTGLVSIGDLVKYRIEHIEHEAESLRSYIQSV